MDYDEIDALLRNSPGWRLLRSDNVVLVATFLGRIFVEENVREIASSELVSKLDDELYALNERLGAGTFPKPAKAYLDHWASPQVGWLRKYYRSGSDEAFFDATPATEKALAWLQSLRARSFVGTESRLNTIFELLRQMAYGAETDPQVRLADLRSRRAVIDDEISRVESGHVDVLDASAQKDRYQQFATTARELLGDFREVEANFRALDRDLRQQIAAWDGSKGELLDEVLSSRSSISDSDQGKSFQVFYDFLLSHQKQEELAALLDQVHSLDDIDQSDQRLRRINHDWLDAGERTQSTVRLLSEQLRRFLDDQVWIENRRVMEILRSIETRALTLRSQVNPVVTMELPATSPTAVLPMERPLYTPATRTAIDSANIEAADTEFAAIGLFEQVYVDKARLEMTVRRALQQQPQIGLHSLISMQPLEQGLAELVSYLALTDANFTVVFDEDNADQIQWVDAAGTARVAELPRVTFVRSAPARGLG